MSHTLHSHERRGEERRRRWWTVLHVALTLTTAAPMMRNPGRLSRKIIFKMFFEADVFFLESDLEKHRHRVGATYALMLHMRITLLHKRKSYITLWQFVKMRCIWFSQSSFSVYFRQQSGCHFSHLCQKFCGHIRIFGGELGHCTCAMRAVHLLMFWSLDLIDRAPVIVWYETFWVLAFITLEPGNFGLGRD